MYVCMYIYNIYICIYIHIIYRDNICVSIYFIFRVIVQEDYETFPSPKEWLDRAKIRYGGRYTDREVDDIKRVVKTYPVWLFLIVYFMLLSQVRYQ